MRSTYLLASAEGAAHEGLSFVGLCVYAMLVIGILLALMAYAKQGLSQRVFRNPVTQLFEQVYLFVEGLCLGTIGSHGRKYIPMIMGLWVVIFTGNVLALFFPASPTADLSFNLAMAITAVAYVQYEGIRTNGLLGHFRHFAGPNLGSLLLIPISILIFVIEIISELMKNVSLSLRLFGNISGGHQAVGALNQLGHGAYLPLGGMLLPLKILTCVVQALIFTLLTCVYLSLVTHHEDHGAKTGEEPAHAH